MKIISGGQTGVDRAALDAALDCAIETGGWCPEGRLSEDGVIPGKYPLEELPGAGYRPRTSRNILDSDGTVIIYFGFPTGGTELTLSLCMKHRKPYLLIDAEELSRERASARIKAFMQQNQIAVLNVAGPRGSREPRAYDYTKHAIIGGLR